MSFSADILAETPGGPTEVDDRVQRLVDAARELANETGNAAFTVTQVAGHAGLSLKSFYRCFRSKDDLLIALLAEESLIGARLFERAIARHDNPFRTFVEQLFALAALPASAGYAGVLVREHRRLREHRPDEIHAALAPLTRLIASFITTADPQRDAQTVFGLLLDGFHDVVLGRVADVPEFADYLYRFCAYGLEGAR
jgi:AcrR family transcriptional regulator